MEADALLVCAGLARLWLRNRDLKFGSKVVGHAGIAAVDSTKVTVNFRTWGLSGVKVAAGCGEHKLAVELADAENVLFLVTYADAMTAWPEIARIVDALQKLATAKLRRRKKVRHRKNLSGHPNFVPPNSVAKNSATQILCTPAASSCNTGFHRQGFYGAKETVPLTQAAGFQPKRSFIRRNSGGGSRRSGDTGADRVLSGKCCRLNLVVHGAADATAANAEVYEA